MRFDVILGEALRRAACPHAADCCEFLRLMNFNPSVTASSCLLPKSEAIYAQLFLTKKQEL
ncbi:MAG: hypothetical protein SPI54_08790 [Oscillospiraceae bacterium]|nr:hypothetical protein [Oscillospiraceae bacterium]